MNETNTLFIWNLPFDLNEEEFKKKMSSFGKLMYINLVKKDNHFKGNAFVRFINKEDSDKFLDLYEKIKINPEKRSILDSNSFL